MTHISRVEKLSGFATLTLATGDEITATWRGGKREGFGKLFGPRLEKVFSIIVSQGRAEG